VAADLGQLLAALGRPAAAAAAGRTLWA